jgi:hypothetical protein
MLYFSWKAQIFVADSYGFFIPSKSGGDSTGRPVKINLTEIDEEIYYSQSSHRHITS